MMVADRNVRDVTPANIRRQQAEREERQAKIRVLKGKIARIEKAITDLAKDPKTSDEHLAKWRQSWDWHTAELKKLEGK